MAWLKEADRYHRRGVTHMTVQQDLEKAVASAESAQGTYLTFSSATQDQTNQQMFKTMAGDMQRHIDTLRDRLSYVTDNNPMNKQS
jgi:rubrerythrin